MESSYNTYLSAAREILLDLKGHVLCHHFSRWLNLSGDIEDLESALDPGLANMSIEDWVQSGRGPRDGHCSALIKILPENADLYVSHVTWNS